MARIKFCLLWHMHQPFYRDLVTGEYRLPWARLHALKDYYGMVRILEEFPDIRQTFNLVPSLLLQLEEYASGKAKDRFLDVVLKEAEELSQQEKEFLLGFCFQANEERVINRYARYAELLERKRQSAQIPGRVVSDFSVPMIRDLQVLSQLAWFDEEYLSKDREIKALRLKGRDFTRADQEVIGRKEKELLGELLAGYRQAAKRRQIEVSTSPFYHPILPLLCDSNIADVSHPYVALPEQFAYPGDASAQMTRAKQYVENAVGIGVQGLWPPEGGVSDEVLSKAAEAGFTWTATGQGVLERTLGHALSTEDKHRPHVWQRDQQRITVLFRDRRLCELIGLVYARMGAEEAADHFVKELHRVSEGKNAVIPVILDGENAWEHYAENGRPFLRALYRRISADPAIEAVTVSQALEGATGSFLDHVYPGSWLDANFDIWIGAEENNCAWELLLRARRKFAEAVSATVENRRLAWEELMIAEGSDWYWWYDPEHSAESRGEFDALFREHLTNVYRLLGERIPAELAHTLLKPQAPEHRAPAGMIQPVIDGRDTTQGEWANAGRYRPQQTSGPMHSQRPPIQELRYGSDGQNLYLWIGCGDATELTVTLRNGAGERFTIDASTSGNQSAPPDATLPAGAVEAVLKDACEMRISLAALHTKLGSPVFVKIDVRSDGLPMGSLPAFGELELKQTTMAAYTF